jgi:hypothetical protein
MSKTEQVERFYGFLVERAKTGASFTVADIVKAVPGWAEETARTYTSKQAKAVIRKSSGRMWAKEGIKYLTQEEFVQRVSQKESILPCYSRLSYDCLVTYEFLMPLTREDTLRRNLDRLFFRDTLVKQLLVIGLDRFSGVVPRKDREPEDSYAGRVATIVSSLFGGYSVFHVNGRFLASPLATQAQAVGKRYIIDETTAVVRFIIPCNCGERTHGERFEFGSAAKYTRNSLDEEIARIRSFFFIIFAEVVVHSIEGEDAIWLLETAASRQRLYIWKRGDAGT